MITRSPGSGEGRTCVGASTIAIDGPAASGKSAVGTLVARRLGFRFVDTGAMYRAITWEAVRRRIDVNDAAAVAALAAAARIEVRASDSGTSVLVDGHDATPHLRDPAVEENVSVVSRVPEVRAVLVRIQRSIAGGGGIVMAGRDIGSVVLPDADLKVYLDASPAVRAERRAEQLRGTGERPDIGALVADIARRDGIDSTRTVSPLTAPLDALRIETDDLDVEEVVDAIVRAAGR
jgi:cytidylate kinase